MQSQQDRLPFDAVIIPHSPSQKCRYSLNLQGKVELVRVSLLIHGLTLAFCCFDVLLSPGVCDVLWNVDVLFYFV